MKNSTPFELTYQVGIDIAKQTLACWRCAVEKTTILEKVSPDHHRKNDQFDAQLLAE